jgi:hypothetical protein
VSAIALNILLAMVDIFDFPLYSQVSHFSEMMTPVFSLTIRAQFLIEHAVNDVVWNDVILSFHPCRLSLNPL